MWYTTCTWSPPDFFNLQEDRLSSNRIPGFAFRYTQRACVLLLSIMMAACLDDPQDPTGEAPLPALETRLIPRPVLPTLHSSAPNLTVCGTPVEFVMTDGHHVPGKMIVSNDAERLYVTYTITQPDWFMSDTRLAISKTSSGIPRDDGGNPAPWSFPTFGEHEPVITAYTYEFKLSDFAAAA